MRIEKDNIIPTTIEIIEILNQIDMFAYEFENLTWSEKYEIVFRIPDVYFISKDGFEKKKELREECQYQKKR